MPFALRSACVAVALLLVAGAASGLPLTKKTIELKTRRMEISVSYPQTGNTAIDAVLLAYARGQVDTFKGYAKDFMGDNPYSLDVGYDVERNDGKMLGLSFGESAYTGGAHGSNTMTAFNFLLPDGAQVFLPEIVDGQRGIDRVSKLVVPRLIKEIATGESAMSDPDWVGRGAGPLADNFKVFVWLPGKLHIYFPPYQVAAYAAGPQEIVIDQKDLKGVIRADWRAPSASFDCAKAKSGIEKAICAGAPLARLDRQMAEAYQAKLAGVSSYDKPGADKLRNEQRAWLAKVLKTCSGPSPGACLTRMYGARLADLTRAPQ
ncbi:MAG: DUF4163 domain-containing protein [Rhizomicrobium sp.]